MHFPAQRTNLRPSNTPVPRAPRACGDSAWRRLRRGSGGCTFSWFLPDYRLRWSNVELAIKTQTDASQSRSPAASAAYWVRCSSPYLMPHQISTHRVLILGGTAPVHRPVRSPSRGDSVAAGGESAREFNPPYGAFSAFSPG